MFSQCLGELRGADPVGQAGRELDPERVPAKHPADLADLRQISLDAAVGPLAASQPDYAYLAGKGLGELLDAELRGTMGSLSGRGRPIGLLELSRVTAPALGELLMLLEAATAFAGPLYGVDPYDQPGVEEAKRLAYAALGREGYR